MALPHHDLVVRVGAHVTRVLIDGNRATGVSYVQHGTETVAHATSEVLLSGGVINSPQLLLLSGIGPAEQLRAHDIDVVADVSGVGENLHDHTMVPLVWATQIRATPWAEAKRKLVAGPCGSCTMRTDA